jgi:predicted transposase YdaD
LLTIDLSENKVLGPAYLRGREEGREEGRAEGRQEGQQEGQLTLLRRQVERRFGTLPAWAEQKLSQCSGRDLEEIGLRVLDATTLEDLFR